MCYRPPDDWFQPDIEITGRARGLIQDHIMILLAGIDAFVARRHEQALETQVIKASLNAQMVSNLLKKLMEKFEPPVPEPVPNAWSNEVPFQPI